MNDHLSAIEYANQLPPVTLRHMSEFYFLMTLARLPNVRPDFLPSKVQQKSWEIGQRWSAFECERDVVVMSKPPHNADRLNPPYKNEWWRR